MSDIFANCRRNGNQPDSTASSDSSIGSKSRSVQYAMRRFTEELTTASSYRTWHTCRYEQCTKRQGNPESRMRRNGARPVRRGEVDVVPGESHAPARDAWPPTLPINPNAHQPSPP